MDTSGFIVKARIFPLAFHSFMCEPSLAIPKAAMNRKEILEFIRGLEADLKTARDFLKVIDRRSGSEKKPEPDNSLKLQFRMGRNGEEESEPSDEQEYGAIKHIVVSAIRLGPEKFTINDLVKTVEQMGKDISKLALQQAIGRLYRSGTLKMVTANKGRIPAVYSFSDAFLKEVNMTK